MFYQIEKDGINNHTKIVIKLQINLFLVTMKRDLRLNDLSKY